MFTILFIYISSSITHRGVITKQYSKESIYPEERQILFGGFTNEINELSFK